MLAFLTVTAVTKFSSDGANPSMFAIKAIAAHKSEIQFEKNTKFHPSKK
jgi:hypothetical protein